MDVSMSLGGDVERRIDELCAAYDPASNPVFLLSLNRIPDHEDREFFLNYARRELRAYAEVAFALVAVARFAEEKGQAHLIALDDLAETAAVQDRLHQFKSRGLMESPEYARWSAIWRYFDDKTSQLLEDALFGNYFKTSAAIL
jgi:hypothetical protein